MRAVIQRVKGASVTFEDKGETITNSIGKGFQVMLGITHEDTEMELKYIIDKIVGLRVFEDQDEKMNLSLRDVNGEILIVSQFTLYADCRKGRRPSFIDAAKPDISSPLYDYFNESLRNQGIHVETGIFGADMKCALINDGPVTIVLDSDDIMPRK